MPPRSEINEEMEKVELHCFGFRPILDIVREELGEDVLEEILLSLGVSIERVTAPDSWMSLKFLERLLEEMVKRSRDPGIIDRAAKRIISPRYLGRFYPMLIAFGSPERCYGLAVHAKPRYDKTASLSIRDVRPGHVILEHRPLEDGPRESGDLFCRIREGMYANMTVLFGIPPAAVRHPSCLHRGDDACVYELDWQAPVRAIAPWVGLGLGAAAGTAVVLLGTVTASLVALVAVVFALAGWSIGNVLKLRREVAARVAEIGDHQEALQQSMRANEERFAELLQSKADVERKVEDRTAELREAGQRLAKTLEQVERLSREKSDFFANVSHDLRTPLTLITGPLDDMAAGNKPAGGTPMAIQAMNRNAKWLLRLINQLLDLSKLEAGRVELVRSPIDLTSLTRSVFQSFAAAAEAKGVEMRFQAPEKIEPCALDPVWIESILNNLLGNALRFVGRGGLVQARVVESRDRLRIEVEDNGRGIEPDELPRIFERFAQAGSYRKRRGGTGIGLALVREAARLHGGDATVESELGKGTRFTVTLPRVRAAPARTSPGGEAGTARTETPETGSEAGSGTSRPNGDYSDPPRAFSDVKDELLEDPSDSEGVADRAGPSESAPLVLVVEDHADTRKYVADVLADHYRVRAASEGKRGLELALELKPDAVVTDIDMPEMDGLELCEQLRRSEPTRTIPVLLLTALGDPSNVVRGFRAGADDYVAKPFHGLELLERLRVQIRLRQMVSDMAHKSRLAMLGQTAASVAHQMRNPLTAISCGLQGFQSKLSPSADPATRELVEMMLDCADRIERITTDLMNVSRIDRAPVDRWRAADGLSSCVRLIRARLPPRVTLQESLDEQAEIEGRPGDLNQVFLNLLDNATRAVGDQGQIELRAESKNGVLQVSVDDSGPGIEPEEREGIFQPFVTTRAAGEGTGLGLSIAKQVIEQHGGTIEVGNSSLGGALFTVRIPIAPPLPEGCDTGEEDIANCAGLTPRRSSGNP